ncbi:MAG: hypothetical protein HY822_01940 [Acidobacteria bacterium]|nr:hypothetical protein [Acidobacteriota bacterium]
MPTTRRTFLAATAATAAPAAAPAALDPVRIARRHAFVRDLPTPDFFEGMLAGNGDIGLCIVVRPDALGLHLGKLDVWDIRVSEDHAQHVLPFDKVLELWKRAGDEAKRQGKPDMLHLESNIPFFREYYDKVRSSYAQPWPRPWPCGTVWLHWDSRWVRVARQQLDPSNGLYTLDLDVERTGCCRIQAFVNWNQGHILVWSDGPAPVTSLAYYPHIDTKVSLPDPRLESAAGEFFCFQLLPSNGQDSNFALCGVLAGDWRAYGPGVAFTRPAPAPLRLDLTLMTPRDAPDNVPRARSEARRLAAVPAARLQAETARAWRSFWSRSAVELADRELERLWYRNQYFLACCLRKGKVAPGLFGNWSAGSIGTAWHGDYHMNYNTQQVFWGVFSSNHVDQHLPYLDLVERLMPIAERDAREMFGLPGAYFPHSAYPVPSQVNAYPVPPWGLEICETPWTVQSLWWHYRCTLDEKFLLRAYPPMRAAARFLAAFLKKGGDGKYHVIPTVSPENWGCTVDFRLNRDSIIDLALAEFLFEACEEASRILGLDAAERERWREIRKNIAPYPKGKGPQGEVWLDVAGAPDEHVYNVPVTLSPVFPAERVGLGRREQLLPLARNTARAVRLEGGNDLVWQPLARARLGMLDLEWFKREVRYCLLPNGVANDRTRQIGGRYSDRTSPDFMMRMGIWTENLSLPVVVNECLMQSYTGVIRLFPNAQGLGRARFENLRAMGAFLVGASWDGKAAADVRLLSERGAEARLLNPWPGRKPVVRSGSADVPVAWEGDVLRFPTRAGASYVVQV